MNVFLQNESEGVKLIQEMCIGEVELAFCGSVLYVIALIGESATAKTNWVSFGGNERHQVWKLGLVVLQNKRESECVRSEIRHAVCC